LKKKPIVHLEPRPATIEPVDVQAEPTRIVIPLKKGEESTVLKTTITTTTTNLHGAPVDLPQIELVTPGPLPTLSLTKEKHKKPKELITTEKPAKVKQSSIGLCASCLGSKAAEKKKKEITSETVQAPIEQTKVIEEEKQGDVPPVIDVSPLPTLSVTEEKHKTSKELITTEKPAKVKKSTVGLCASCLGTKASEKKKKEITSETTKAPIEPPKVVEEVKEVDVPLTTTLATPAIESSPLSTLTVTEETHKTSKELITTEKPAKVKKPSVGLCASCLGTKAGEKKKKKSYPKLLKHLLNHQKLLTKRKQMIYHQLSKYHQL